MPRLPHRPPPRLLGAGPCLAVALGLLVGCGGSDSAVEHKAARDAGLQTTVAPAEARPSVAVRGMSARAQYAAFARAVNLQAADVPGFTKARGHPHEGRGERSLEAACGMSLPSARGLETFPSARFEAGPAAYKEHAGSEVQIAASPAAARAYVGAEQRIFSEPRLRGCLGHAFAREMTASAERLPRARLRVLHSQAEVKALTTTPAPVGAEASGGAAIGVVMTLTTSGSANESGVRLTVFITGRYFSFGRAIVTLSTWAFDTGFPQALESQLLASLGHRASVESRRYPAIRAA